MKVFFWSIEVFSEWLKKKFYYFANQLCPICKKSMITITKLWFLIAPYSLNLTLLNWFCTKNSPTTSWISSFLFLANQIVMRAAFLEDENGKLQKEVDETVNMNTIIRNDVTFLSKRLSQYQCNRQPQATAIM